MTEATHPLPGSICNDQARRIEMMPPAKSPRAIGDACKRLEAAEAERAALPGLPVMARLDGRAFHTLTRGLPRPWDPRLAACMDQTAMALVDKLGARTAYTQSDEITLLWWADQRDKATLPFNGRFQKLASVAAGLASAAFNQAARISSPAVPGLPNLYNDGSQG